MRRRHGEGPDAGDSRCEASGEFRRVGTRPCSTPEALLNQYRSARCRLNDTLDVIEVLSHWRLELQAKLARKKLIFLYCDSDVDFAPLEAEARDFVRVSKILTWARRQQP
jgi:hypothetical protein